MATTAGFALLDDATAPAGVLASRLYTEWVESIVLREASAFAVDMERLQQALARGLHAVGLFTYELGARLQGVTPRHAVPEFGQILLFRRCQRLDREGVTAWLAQQETGDEPAGVADLAASVDEVGFTAAVERIHALIAAGETYQVNYTWRLDFSVFGSPIALYRRLRARQPVPYGALIRLPDERWVLSLSPELLARHAKGRLVAEPMKGTLAASMDAADNARRAAQLASDPKNRAENLMIVDLLRNDLSRIARPGSVKVPELFAVRQFGEVLQMTSTIHAEPAAGVDLAAVLTALLPSGSVTGAPKKHTLELISALETLPRGLYTGAIGWFEHARRPASASALRPHGNFSASHLPEFCLSVPIRTLTLSPPAAYGLRRGVLGVGAGIVQDSVAREEWRECWLKACFLSELAPDFALIETLRASREGISLLDRHLARLAASARYFGFALDEAKLRRQLAAHCATLDQGGVFRLRLELSACGEVSLSSSPLPKLDTSVTVLLAPPNLCPPLPALFLRHKTTQRAVYDAAWRTAEATGAFDVLFFNAAGELTEGARSNVFVKLGGRWWTPPLTAGLLPGVMRAALLDDPAWAAGERRLTRGDLFDAEAVVVCNALRGVLPAKIDWQTEVQ
ncbi:MAG: aminodeoxychorismate synthase component I [Betaproteobacteria bacterium HGW-Betaproteobacteria-11]|nr:MAG: aminodeoxychorismate synthase component I [Betaproteobacteria bacterium HGW-Betaproteobacteria-11]